MLDLNYDHPNFAMDMELLALLTTKPTPKRLLVLDLGLDARNDIGPLMASLQEKGFDVHGLRVVGGETSVCIKRGRERLAHDAAAMDLADVYGDE